MEIEQVAAALQKIVRGQLRECEEAVRDHDPVRALNDLADAKNAILEILKKLER